MQSSKDVGSTGGAEHATPDMLKNTPSNIRKLAGEIEQHEGRKKYLAQTRSPSDGGDVRWYFCKVPLAVNERAASVPRTDIVGKGDYFRFGMRDSLAIEASFLQREEELLSSWWKEYAECSDGPTDHSNTSSMSSPPKKDLPTGGSPDLTNPQATEEERVGVPVKGGLYEVDLTARHCFPVYWDGENRRVLRGHWFALKGGLDWLPLREDVSEQLEYAYRFQVWHRRTFQQSGLFAARVDLRGSTPGLHALFTGEDDTWEARLGIDASGISSFIGFGRNGVKLRRGYAPSESQKPTQDELRQQQEEEMDDYCSQVPVKHLVFMVHGIGQRLENSNLVDDVGSFRQLTESLAERHLNSNQRGTQRVLFIPCQWRKCLTLSGETAVEKITLDGVRGLRTMLGATVHDVLYYMSPVYCQDIIDSVSHQLNRLYLKFLKRNPGYDGKVSLYGHSLGTVLSYDILCNQEKLQSSFPREPMHKNPSTCEVPCSDTNRLSFGSHPTRNSSSYNVSNGSMIGPKNADPTVEDSAGGSNNPVGPSLSSESDDSTSKDTVCKLLNDASPSNENGDKPFGNSSYKDSCEMINNSNSMKSEIFLCDENKIGKDECNTDKDEIIESLRKEMDLLKEKIKEFEANAKKVQAEANLSDSESVQPRKQDTLKSYTPHIQYTKLEFNVDTFFAVGSPLGVFLSLRNVRIGIGKGKEYWEEENVNEEMPACRQMINIFHPFDPVAYRIEPLICKELTNKRPVIVPYHRGGKRLYVGFQEFKEGVALRSQDLMDQLSYVKVKVLTFCEARSNDGQDEPSEETQEKQERSYGSFMIERLTGSEEGRIDHVLQDKTFRHPYLSAIGSHTNYWRDPDTSLFVLRHLYRDIPEEPSTQLEGSSKQRDQLKGWSDPRAVTDEDLPLTFSDDFAVKNFSRKAKKMMGS